MFDMIWIVLAALVPCGLTLLGTEYVRKYAVRTRMVDVPNERSSHTAVTPRGGGLAIATTVLGTLLLLAILLPAQRSAAIGILIGGVLIAAIGLLDDRFNLGVKTRLFVHFLAATWTVCWLGGMNNATIGGIELGVLPALFAIVFIVWSTNLYNFMDGLDGLAGGQALVAATAAALICYWRHDTLLAFLMFSTAGAAAGFLVWNWPPARIFMGDCGSGFLGFLFGAVMVTGFGGGSISIPAGLTLLCIFLVDATLTLFRRILRGEAWYQPHRTHAYQLATQLGATHLQVVTGACIGFVIAALLAIAMTYRPQLAPIMGLGCALAVVGIWMLINGMYVAKRNALALVTLPNSRLEEEPTVVHLRLRNKSSSVKARRLDMPKNDLLSEATVVASDLGYRVSHDWLEGCGGGRCEAAGGKWILLDFNMSKQDQIRQILLAIHDEAKTLDTISSGLRSALAATATDSAPEAPADMPKAA